MIEVYESCCRVVGWGAGCIGDVRVAGSEVEMDSDLLGVWSKSVW